MVHLDAISCPFLPFERNAFHVCDRVRSYAIVRYRWRATPHPCAVTTFSVFYPAACHGLSSGQVGKGKCHIVDTFWQTETGGHVMLPLANVTPTKPGSCSFPFFGIEVCCRLKKSDAGLPVCNQRDDGTNRDLSTKHIWCRTHVP